MQFPRTNVGGASLSRLIVGTNWFLGYSHYSVAKDKLIKNTQTRDKIADILEVFLEAGIDSVMGPMVPLLADAVQEAQQRSGKEIKLILTPWFDILPGGALEEPMKIFLDLWHGKCRDIYFVSEGQEIEAAFTLQAPFDNFVKILKGELDPMQAMMTRKLSVKGSMSYMLSNVPTVLCFVRCCQDVTDDVLGE